MEGSQIVRPGLTTIFVSTRHAPLHTLCSEKCSSNISIECHRVHVHKPWQQTDVTVRALFLYDRRHSRFVYSSITINSNVLLCNFLTAMMSLSHTSFSFHYNFMVSPCGPLFTEMTLLCLPAFTNILHYITYYLYNILLKYITIHLSPKICHLQRREIFE